MQTISRAMSLLEFVVVVSEQPVGWCVVACSLALQLALRIHSECPPMRKRSANEQTRRTAPARLCNSELMSLPHSANRASNSYLRSALWFHDAHTGWLVRLSIGRLRLCGQAHLASSTHKRATDNQQHHTRWCGSTAAFLPTWAGLEQYV